MTSSSHRRKWRRNSVYDVIVRALLLQLPTLATALPDLPDDESTGKSFSDCFTCRVNEIAECGPSLALPLMSRFFWNSYPASGNC